MTTGIPPHEWEPERVTPSEPKSFAWAQQHRTEGDRDA